MYRNQFGNVIYIGKAKNLRKRMSSYFQKGRIAKAEPKLRSLINSIAKYEFFVVKNEDEALILESKLIKEYAPKYNILLRDDKRFLSIKINLNEKYPKLKLTRLNINDNATYFGPYPSGNAVKKIVEYLNKEFGLRVCSSDEPNIDDHKHCLAGVVKDCLEPCVERVNQEQYLEAVKAVINVLNGDVTGIVAKLEEKLSIASKKLRFEKAAELRDMIRIFKEVCTQKKRSFKHLPISNNLGEESVIELKKVLGLNILPNHIEAFDNSHLGGTFTVSSMVCFINGKSAKNRYKRFKIKTVDKIDDFASMKEVIYRQYSRKLREKDKMPDLILIDGGKGQLSCAIEALYEAGAPPIPIIGLAKRNEEIIIPGRKENLVIDKHSIALRLLQAIRDESHRFAISYNRELRNKKITESILDDIPGIGEKRKLQILREFGSLSNLKKASINEISERVSGLGKKMSKTIYEKLHNSKK